MTGLRGFGLRIEGGTPRNWYAGDDGVRRWADNDQPVDIPTPEAPMPHYPTPDLGCPDQGFDEPKPFEYGLTPSERSKVASFAVQLGRKRREANKRDADRDIARLCVVFTDGDAA